MCRPEKYLSTGIDYNQFASFGATNTFRRTVESFDTDKTAMYSDHELRVTEHGAIP